MSLTPLGGRLRIGAVTAAMVMALSCGSPASDVLRFTVSGIVSGLAGTGLVLQNNGVDDHSISGSGTVQFSFTPQVIGSSYKVTVSTHPTGPNQYCSVANGTGDLLFANVEDVLVSCVNTYDVSGTVTGLAGTGLELGDGLGHTVSGDSGTFLFQGLPDGSWYDISVVAQPKHLYQTCVVTAGGTGTLAGSDVMGVQVDCTTNPVSVKNLIVRPLTVVSGETVRLVWRTENATSCEINPGAVAVGAADAEAGFTSQTVNAATDFTLTCQGPSGPTTSPTVSVSLPETDWAQVSAGTFHSCAVKTDGRLFCWGRNTSGRLGNNASLDSVSLTPVQEYTAATDWKQVEAGDRGTCALKTDKRLFCWGNNDYGQLGDGWRGLRTIPTQEKTKATDWAQASTGSTHTCAVKTDGRLFCWGNNADGQLGDNKVSGAYSTVPVQEDTAAADWMQVSAGYTHTCAVKTDGRLYCWGASGDGKLGNGSFDSKSVPTQEDSAASDWSGVAAGANHTCALKTGGAIYCWGLSFFGETGSDPNFNSMVPVQETTMATDWDQLSVGVTHTCGIKTDSRLFCWGDNINGRVGDNGVPGPEPYEPRQEATMAADWAQVSAGNDHTCALKSSGMIFCWGLGPLGDGSTAVEAIPIPEASAATDWADIAVRDDYSCGLKSGGELFCWGRGFLVSGPRGESMVPAQEYSAASDWADIAPGYFHACAVKTDGRLFCLGSDGFGELGDNGAAGLDSDVWVQEATGASSWSQVATGTGHTCGVKTDGRLFCWGANAYGQLGNTPFSGSSSFVPVQEYTRATDWLQVSAGWAYTCAVKTDGRLFCWGDDYYGQLGVGGSPYELRRVPTQETTKATDWVEVSAGGVSACAIKTDGRLFCWGSNFSGQLGDGGLSLPQSLVPVQEITAFNDWASVSVGDWHACAVKMDGRISCWGGNWAGQLGDNGISGDSSASPVQEYLAITDWARVSAGASHTCAITTSGRAFCWGSSEYGQLGEGKYPRPIWMPE